MTYTRFKVNAPTVTHETIDGEAVIINLESGCYYSLVEVGATVWDLLYQGAPVNEIVTAISTTHAGDAAEIERAVTDLIQQLRAENLVVPDESETPLAQFSAAPNHNGHQKTAFRAPVLQKFTDMQELLLLDPIHDVDDMGWPKPNPEIGK
jgi:hypothetical protein